MGTSRSREDEHEGKNHAEKDDAQKNHAVAAPRPLVKRKRRWLRRAGLAALVLVALLLGLRTYLYVDYVLALRAYRAAGHPTTLAEFEAKYPMPPGVNGWPLLEQAAAMVKEPSKEENDLVPVTRSVQVPPLGQPWPTGMQEASEVYIERYTSAFGLLREALDCDYCRYPFDPTGGISSNAPDMGGHRRLAQLLKLRHALRRGVWTPMEAIDAVEETIDLAQTLHRGGSLITELSGMAILGSSAEQVRWILNAASLPDDDLQRLDALAGRLFDADGMIAAYEGETLIGLATFTEIRGGTWPFGGVAFEVIGIGDLNKASYLRGMRKVLEAAAKLDLRDRVRASVELDELADELGSLHWMSQLLLPSGLATSGHVAHLLRAQSIRVAVCVERFRLAHGRAPTVLKELIPMYLEAVPEDAFSDAPLRYIRLDDGYVIYSVGRDGVDDGGAVEDGRDIGIRVQRPDLRAAQ